MDCFTQSMVVVKHEHYCGKSTFLPRRVNTLVTDYDTCLSASFHDVIATGPDPRHPQVVNLVQKLLDPPSDQMIKLARRVVITPQAKAVIKILNNMVGHILSYMKEVGVASALSFTVKAMCVGFLN